MGNITWGIFLDQVPQFQPGHIRSRDALGPITRAEKYLMDYNLKYVSEVLQKDKIINSYFIAIYKRST